MLHVQHGTITAKNTAGSTVFTGSLHDGQLLERTNTPNTELTYSVTPKNPPLVESGGQLQFAFTGKQVIGGAGRVQRPWGASVGTGVIAFAGLTGRRLKLGPKSGSAYWGSNAPVAVHCLPRLWFKLPSPPPAIRFRNIRSHISLSKRRQCVIAVIALEQPKIPPRCHERRPIVPCKRSRTPLSTNSSNPRSSST